MCVYSSRRPRLLVPKPCLVMGVGKFDARVSSRSRPRKYELVPSHSARWKLRTFALRYVMQKQQEIHEQLGTNLKSCSCRSMKRVGVHESWENKNLGFGCINATKTIPIPIPNNSPQIANRFCKTNSRSEYFNLSLSGLFSCTIVLHHFRVRAIATPIDAK